MVSPCLCLAAVRNRLVVSSCRAVDMKELPKLKLSLCDEEDEGGKSEEY